MPRSECDAFRRPRLKSFRIIYWAHAGRNFFRDCVTINLEITWAYFRKESMSNDKIGPSIFRQAAPKVISCIKFPSFCRFVPEFDIDDFQIYWSQKAARRYGASARLAIYYNHFYHWPTKQSNISISLSTRLDLIKSMMLFGHKAKALHSSLA